MDPVAMTFTAVGWLMSSLVNKAVTALLEAWAKRMGLGNEFKTLKNQLLQLSALLTSARGLRINNDFLKELVENLQQLAYRAENLLDELDYCRLQDEIQQRGPHEKVNCNNISSIASSSSDFRLTSRSILSTLKGMSCCYARDALVPLISLPTTFSSRINLSRRMNQLAQQLKKSDEEVRYALETESLVITARNTEISQTEATNLHQTSSFLTEPIVFGRDQERDQLMNQLTNEESAKVGKISVLAIVGSGGVGKTTLAQLVFNDPKVQSYFNVRLWICVSTRFDSIRLTREMLEGACGKRYDELSNLNELQIRLENGLESKRFLLVLDDMWEDENKSQWDSIVAPLNNCRVKGSIILVTTRNQSVAKMVDTRDNIYLQGLEDNSFLSFFSACIFNAPNFGGNRRLRNIGKQISNKLKGNPLAAKTVGALLKGRHEERYWMEIRDSEEWKSQSGPNDIMPALRLSYEHMPFHLQRCFSYCAIFPENHTFICEELVYLWMAQGFLNVRSEGKRMEDIGSSYFNDLFNRGFFQTKESTYHEETRYTFHDLIYDLAHMVAFKEYLTIDGLEPRQITPTIRHLSFCIDMSLISSRTTEEVELKDAELEKTIVRALACLEGESLSTILLIKWKILPSGIFQSILHLLKESKFLRALELHQKQLHIFNFHNFVSLRYLGLTVSNCNTFKTLPSEICRLYHLEVFEIVGQCFQTELPNNFSDLVSLRHFINEGELHSKICGVGKLTSLQELNCFDVQQKKGFEIEQLGSLKEIGGQLHINNLENVKSKAEANKARLGEKDKLHAFYLKWNHGEQENENVLEGLKPNTNLKLLEIDGYGGVASPTWLDPSLIFLESLILVDCKAWDLLPPIGELEFLKNLELSGLAVREIGPHCYGTRQNIKFPSLEELSIIDMPDLETWVWNDQLELSHCFQNLYALTIRNCPKLVDFPLLGCNTSEALERFPYLECLIIEDCPLICKLPVPLPLFSFISIQRIGFVESISYVEEAQEFSLKLDECSSLKVGELLAFQELSPLISLEMSDISSLESLDLYSFMALKKLVIEGCQSLTSITFGEHLVSAVIKECQSLTSLTFGEHLVSAVIKECQSLTSLTFGEHLVCLETLQIISCEALSSIKGLKSWVNLEWLHFRECPGFIAAWDSASKEIERIEPDFSLSPIEIKGDSLALLTLPICKQLSSLQILKLEFSAFTEAHQISLQLVTSIDLVDIRGCKNLQSFPFDLFFCLKELIIKFPHIQSLPESSCTEIIEECKKLRNIGEVEIIAPPVQVIL